MHLELFQSGGFAGIVREGVRIDSDRLSHVDEARLRDLTERAGFFTLPRSMRVAEGADIPSYRLSIKDGDRSHTVDVDERSLSPALRALIEWCGGGAST